MCALCGRVVAAVCKRRARLRRARGGFAQRAPESQLARTRIFDRSAAVGVESGSKLITSQLFLIGNGRSGAQSSARFEGRVIKNRSLGNTLAFTRLPMRPLAHKVSLEASWSSKAADAGIWARYV